MSAPRPLCYGYSYESLLFRSVVSMNEGQCVLKAINNDTAFNDIFESYLTNSICFHTDGSKSENYNFVGLTTVEADNMCT